MVAPTIQYFLICSQVYLDKYILCVFKLNQNDSEVWMSQENLINFLHLIRVQLLELGQTHIHMYFHTERFTRKIIKNKKKCIFCILIRKNVLFNQNITDFLMSVSNDQSRF